MKVQMDQTRQCDMSPTPPPFISANLASSTTVLLLNHSSMVSTASIAAGMVLLTQYAVAVAFAPSPMLKHHDTSSSMVPLPSLTSRSRPPITSRRTAIAAQLIPLPSQRQYALHSIVAPRSATSLFTQINQDDGEEHLQGIGVGIDLGTTNSAVAMMIPSGEGRNGYVCV